MRSYITEKYKNFFNLKGAYKFVSIIINLPGFILEIKRNKKFNELKSFIKWEITHFLKLWKNQINIETIHFSNYSRILNVPSNETFQLTNRIKGKLSALNTVFDKIFIDNFKNIFGTAENILNLVDVNGTILKDLFQFKHKIDSLYITSGNDIFISAGGTIFKSNDNGLSFKKVLKMTSGSSKFLFHVGMTEINPDILLIGEYSNIWDKKKGWINASNLYVSHNRGNNWIKINFLKSRGVNKHIHMVRYLKNLDLILLTDGDNKKQLWVTDAKNFKTTNIKNNIWKLLTSKHSSLGGYTAILEHNSKVILGTDYFGGTNFITETRDFISFEKRVISDPYRRGQINCFIKTKDIIWTIIQPPAFNNSRGIIMYSTDAIQWYKFITFKYENQNIEIVSNYQNESNLFYFTIRNLKNKKTEKIQTYKLEILDSSFTQNSNLSLNVCSSINKTESLLISTPALFPHRADSV